jgi:penicillin-binding protein 2
LAFNGGSIGLLSRLLRPLLFVDMVLRLPTRRPILKASSNVGRDRQALLLMGLVVALLLGGLGSRLAYLQLLSGQQNRTSADENRIRLIARQPERGKILDRRGKTMAGSTLTHSVFVWPLAMKDRAKWDLTIARLSQILGQSVAVLQKPLLKETTSPYRVRITRNITKAQITAIQENSGDLAGVEVDAETARIYPMGSLAAHIIGYTGELSDEDYDKLKGRGYRLGDVNGKMGAEAAFESQLRGEWGGQQVEVNGTGKVLRVLGEKQTRMGKDIHLTIDMDLQKAAEAAIGEQIGSIVALNPNTGEVLAMVSRPGFDPNVFAKARISQADWDKIAKNPNDPFMNRAVRAFPPASTYKIITTTAAVESGIWPIGTVLQTFPSYTRGDTTFGEWNHAGFGPLGFSGAITNSSDTFFYQIAVQFNNRGEKPSELSEWSRKFGFGSKTGIELIEDEPGIVPDPAWKRKTFNQDWVEGDSINMSIGQGDTIATPLQVAVMFSVIANGGYRVKPHLLKDDQESKQWRESLNIKPDTLKVIQSGLRGVVTQTTGTILDVSHLPLVAGKSGTSEDMGRGSHTWFGAYAPFDKPEIVVVAFGELSGGSGGEIAAPMVKPVLEAYFQKAHKKPAQTP